MGTIRYRCITCDEQFETEDPGPGGEARCPKCHRVHDVVRVSLEPAVPWFRRTTTLGVGALLVVAAAVVGVYVLRMKGDGPQAETAPSIPPATSAEVSQLLARVPDLADAAALAESGAAADRRARALGALFAALASAGRPRVFDPESPNDLAGLELLPPADLLQKDVPRTTSLQAALLALRVAKTLGLDAKLVRIERYGTEPRPADPSGLFGHFALAVRGAGGPDGLLVLDPQRPGGVVAERADLLEVTDAEAGGILEGYRALGAVAEPLPGQQPDAAAAAEHLRQARELAPDAAVVRVATALLSVLQRDPGRAFAEAEALTKSPRLSERVAAAELQAMLGRVDRAEPLLAEVERIYTAWPRIPVVRAQMALLRATSLVRAAAVLSMPDRLPAGAADQIRAQLGMLGLSESDRPEEQFALAGRFLDDAERLGASSSVPKLRELLAAAKAEFLLASRGDLDGARALLQEVVRRNPKAAMAALPLASILLAQGDEDGAHGVLEPLATTDRPVETWMEEARGAAERLRPLLAARAAASAGNPFDLSNPMTPPAGTEPSLQMPSLGGNRPGPLSSGGLQLRL